MGQDPTKAPVSLDEIAELLKSLTHAVHIEFVVSLVVGLAGLLYAVLAYKEAGKAKRAATEAKRVVRIQTVTVELGEIQQRLARLSTQVSFEEARDLLSEVGNRLRRFTAPYRHEKGLDEVISLMHSALDAARTSLDNVRPTGDAAPVPMAVYNAVEGPFATINGAVATLLGLLETHPQSVGESDA